uniref:Lipoprotein n=1 Tax=Neisseria polysaccharea TaxID=489 RepID=Q83VH1_NEIPO|nr:unknown [Neisseria polysaccharea]
MYPENKPKRTIKMKKLLAACTLSLSLSACTSTQVTSFVEGLSEGLVDVSEAFITTKAESYSDPSLQDKQIFINRVSKRAQENYKERRKKKEADLLNSASSLNESTSEALSALKKAIVIPKRPKRSLGKKYKNGFHPVNTCADVEARWANGAMRDVRDIERLISRNVPLRRIGDAIQNMCMEANVSIRMYRQECRSESSDFYDEMLEHHENFIGSAKSFASSLLPLSVTNFTTDMACTPEF